MSERFTISRAIDSNTMAWTSGLNRQGRLKPSLQPPDSTFVSENLPRSLAIGMAIQPNEIGQPPVLAWTISASPIAFQSRAESRGRLASVPRVEVVGGKST